MKKKGKAMRTELARGSALIDRPCFCGVSTTVLLIFRALTGLLTITLDFIT